MPPERSSAGGPRQPEQDAQPYQRVAGFPTEETAGRAYFEAQQAIYKQEHCDLSVYRLQLNQAWHLVIVGLTPPPELERRLVTILSTGEPATLPDSVLLFLRERRAKAARQAPWTERHFRPGRRP